MKKRLLLLAAFLAVAVPASASEVQKFIVTIEKVELKTTDAQWITVLEPDKEVDLVNEEAAVAFFNNHEKVPPGRYVNFRLTLSETVRFAGNDKHNFTREGGRATLKGTAEKASQLPGEFTAFEQTSPTYTHQGPAGTVTLKLDLDNADADDVLTIAGKHDLGTPLEIKKGSYVRFWFDLDLENCVHYAWRGAFRASSAESVPDADAMYALPPKQIDSLTVTVDDREETYGPTSVDFDF